MDNDAKHQHSLVEYLLSAPVDEEFAEILEHIRDCGCGLSNEERQYFHRVCDAALAEGPQILQRATGNLVIMTDEEYRTLAGSAADSAPVWKPK